MQVRVVFSCLVLVMSVGTWTIGPAAGGPGERVAAEDPGKRVYDAKCSRCHGAEGRGASQGPKLVPLAWSEEKVLDLVRNPRCDMPPFSEAALSDAEVAQIVNYLRTIE